MLPAGRWAATSWVYYTTSCNTQSCAPEDGSDHRPKHVALIGIINQPLLLHIVGVYIIYKQYQICFPLRSMSVNVTAPQIFNKKSFESVRIEFILLGRPVPT